MRIIFILISILLFLNISLNGQTRNIVGRVILEDLGTVPGIYIQNIDKLLLGETDFDGFFNINIPKETDKLLFYWISMEPTTIKLQDDCDTIEIIMMYRSTYDFMSSRKVDRLRKKEFNKLPKLHTLAVRKGLFTKDEICYLNEFKPIKSRLDKIDQERRIERERIQKTFKNFSVGDTIRVPYFSSFWADDEKNEITLNHYTFASYETDCIIKGVITNKNKVKRDNGFKGYDLIYKVISCEECQYDKIILNEKELKSGVLVEYGVRF